MIALITGRLAAKSPGEAIVDAGGIGYQVHIPLSSFYELPAEGETVRLFIHTHVREDALQLYGFLTRKEKDLFLALMSVSGVGPKLALNIVSGLPFDQLVDALSRGDDKKVSTIPGIGPKTAARLVLELRDKAAALGVDGHGPCAAVSTPNRERDEAVSALVNLGYKKPLAEEAVKRTCTSGGEEMPIETLIRDALKMLSKG